MKSRQHLQETKFRKDDGSRAFSRISYRGRVLKGFCRHTAHESVRESIYGGDCQSQYAGQVVSATSSITHTVLTLNTPTTLSRSVPVFGTKPSSFDNVLAKLSTRVRTSVMKYSAPVNPQVNGGLD